MKLTTTLSQIRANDPCEDGLEKLLKHLGHNYPDDKEIDLLTILESNGIDHLFWALITVEDQELAKRIAVGLAIRFSEKVLPNFEKENTKNNKPRKAIDAAKAWLRDGESSLDKLDVLVLASDAREAAVSSSAAAHAAGMSSACAAESAALDPVAFAAAATSGAAIWAAVSEKCEQKLLPPSKVWRAKWQTQIEIIKELLA